MLFVVFVQCLYLVLHCAVMLVVLMLSYKTRSLIINHEFFALKDNKGFVHSFIHDKQNTNIEAAM